MDIDRIVLANALVFVIVLVVGFVTYESLPVVAFLIGAAYVTFSAMITFAWGMTRL